MGNRKLAKRVVKNSSETNTARKPLLSSHWNFSTIRFPIIGHFSTTQPSWLIYWHIYVKHGTPTGVWVGRVWFEID